MQAQAGSDSLSKLVTDTVNRVSQSKWCKTIYSGLQNKRNIVIIGACVLVVSLVVVISCYGINDVSAEDSKTRSKRNVDGFLSENSGGSRGATQSTYVRLGRKTCPGDATLVYEGVAGGQHYTHSGGGSTYLCLPREPLYGAPASYTDAAEDNGGLVYGAEYEMVKGAADNFPFSHTNAQGPLHDQDVPCAVCLSPRGPVLMVPARNACYPGWQLEYAGMLMTEHFSHANNRDFVCVDQDPERADAGVKNENGALFYKVEGRTGSLPSPPYVNGRELTCAVCSKA